MRTEARFPHLERGDGHYESFYIKACRPGGGRALWLRHTVHKRPGEDATASLWLTLFDADADGPRATKATYGADRISTAPDVYIRVGEAELREGRATGSLATDAIAASWDLRFADEHEPFFHLPSQRLYRASLPKTKLLSPYPNATFDGTVQVGDERVDVDGWRGMIGHNWGSEHAERWVWIHGAAFEGRPDGDYLDIAAGRIKIAGLRTPWVANGNLVLDGEAHRLGGLGHIPSTEIEEEPTDCRFELRGRGIKVRGRVGGERRDFVAWIYADPVGPGHNTLNCSISDLELEIERDGAPPERLTIAGAAAYELGTRDTDHGIPVQPYPDG